MTSGDPAIEFAVTLDDYVAGEEIHRRVFAGNADSAEQIARKMYGLPVLAVEPFRDWMRSVPLEV